jgi:hypothetical protein
LGTTIEVINVQGFHSGSSCLQNGEGQNGEGETLKQILLGLVIGHLIVANKYHFGNISRV